MVCVEKLIENLFSWIHIHSLKSTFICEPFNELHNNWLRIMYIDLSNSNTIWILLIVCLSQEKHF